MRSLSLAFTIFVTVITLQIIPALEAHAHPNKCAAIHRQVSKSYTGIQQQLEWDMAHVDLALKRLEVKSMNLKPVRFLGKGSTGVVYQVLLNGKHYALKVFQKLQYSVPVPVLEMFERDSQREGILIQRALGDLDLAPKVVGLLNFEQTQQWLSNQSKWIQELPIGKASLSKSSVALLMELTESKTAKSDQDDNGTAIRLTNQDKEKLYEQAERLLQTLHELQIVPNDLDFVITPQKNLLLIDVGFFYQAQEPRRPGLLQEFKKYIDSHSE